MSDVVVVRGSRQVIDPGIGGPAGRVHAPPEDLAQGIEAGSAHAGADDQTLDLGVVFDPAHLEGIGTVVDNDDLVKIGSDQVNEVLLALAELQIGHAGGEVVIIAVVGAAGIGISGALVVRAVHDGTHVVGQVSTFPSAAGQHQHGGVRESPGVGEHLIGIGSGGGFRQRPVLPVADGDGRTIRAVGGVEIAQLGVGVKACILQPLQQADRRCDVHGAGAGAAVDGVGGGPAKDIDVGGVGQGQSGILVPEQNNALLRDLLNHLAGVFGGPGGDAASVTQRHLKGIAHRAEADHVDHDAKEQHERRSRLPARKAPPAFRHLPCGGHERKPCCKADSNDRQRDSDPIQRAEHVFPRNLDPGHVSPPSGPYRAFFRTVFWLLL